MKCPKCGFIQNDAEECVKCGIIIEKYLKYIKRRSNRLSEPETIKGNNFSHGILLILKSFLKASKQVTRAVCLKLKINPVNKTRILGVPRDLLKVLKNAAGSENVRIYERRLCDQIMQIGLTVVLTALLNTGLLFLCNMLWWVYGETPAGRQFTDSFADRAQTITAILGPGIVRFSIELTLTALSLCVFISVACQFFHISRHLYHSRGFFGKIFLWGGSITAVVAICIESVYEFDDFLIAGSLALIPVLCLFPVCFESSDRLVPEFCDLIEKRLPLRTRLFSILYSHIVHFVECLEKQLHKSNHS